MKDLQKVYIECVQELRGIGMDISNKIVKVCTNGRLKTTLGRCCRDRRSGNYTIEVNLCMLADGVEIASTKNTIIHELLHTCPGCMNHGNEWRRRGDMVKQKLGYDISRCESKSELEAAGVKVAEAEYKYALVCQSCGYQYKRKRWSEALENPSRYNCRCGGKLKVIGLNGNEVWTARPIWNCASPV